jgi:hypothetical protein
LKQLKNRIASYINEFEKKEDAAGLLKQEKIREGWERYKKDLMKEIANGSTPTGITYK